MRRIIYILEVRYVFIFDGTEWRIEKFVDGARPGVCALNEKTNSIYVFGWGYSSIWKYYIDDKEVDILEQPNICHANWGRAITQKNGKAYLQGCHVRSWETVIFNLNTEQFETESIKISDSSPGYLPYYTMGQLVVR